MEKEEENGGENTMKLHFISHCGKEWLVGINGQDITKIKTSGGKKYLAIGNEEIGKKCPCKICGEMVEVKEMEPETKQRTGTTITTIG